jgi:hypothetical protein
LDEPFIPRPSEPPFDPALKISIAGRLIPQAAIVELKRNNVHQPDTMAIIATSSFFSRVRTVCLGTTDADGLTRIALMDATDHVNKWAQRQQHVLKTLHALIQKMREHVSNSASGMCLLRPLSSTKDLSKRRWEIYDVEENDPILQNIHKPFNEVESHAE